jgi:hypothetical protein
MVLAALPVKSSAAHDVIETVKQRADNMAYFIFSILRMQPTKLIIFFEIHNNSNTQFTALYTIYISQYKSLHERVAEASCKNLSFTNKFSPFAVYD